MKLRRHGDNRRLVPKNDFSKLAGLTLNRRTFSNLRSTSTFTSYSKYRTPETKVGTRSLLQFQGNQIAIRFSSRPVIDRNRAAFPVAGKIVRSDQHH